MSVPAALTALLRIDQAYGLQLHSELGSRLPHRATTNVGQIYSTLERLVRDGYVERSGETHDNLPLYAITEAGMTWSDAWLAGEELSAASQWSEILDVLLLGASIPGSPVVEATSRVTKLFAEPSPNTGNLYELANLWFSEAVLKTAASVQRDAENQTLPMRAFSAQRPTRGRKPVVVT